MTLDRILSKVWVYGLAYISIILIYTVVSVSSPVTIFLRATIINIILAINFAIQYIKHKQNINKKKLDLENIISFLVLASISLFIYIALLI